MAKPSGSAAGMSFMEWTAMSARPSWSAFSSSLMKRPLPPAAARLRSWMRSPSVTIGTRLTTSPGWQAARRAATCSACHSASRLLRVAIRTCPDMRHSATGTTAGPGSGHEAPRDVRRQPAADRQRRAAAQAHDVMTLGVALERLHVRDRDERIAMDAHEARGEFLLERLQRLLDEFLAAGMAQRRVFLLGDEAGDVRDRDEPELVARAHGDARAHAAGALRDARELRARRAPRAVEGLLQLVRAHRLQEVAGRLRVEGRERVLIE